VLILIKSHSQDSYSQDPGPHGSYDADSHRRQNRRRPDLDESGQQRPISRAEVERRKREYRKGDTYRREKEEGWREEESRIETEERERAEVERRKREDKRGSGSRRDYFDLPDGFEEERESFERTKRHRQRTQDFSRPQGDTEEYPEPYDKTNGYLQKFQEDTEAQPGFYERTKRHPEKSQGVSRSQVTSRPREDTDQPAGPDERHLESTKDVRHISQVSSRNQEFAYQQPVVYERTKRHAERSLGVPEQGPENREAFDNVS
jgi:hypothetical protein